jgi:hypothetical protein
MKQSKLFPPPINFRSHLRTGTKAQNRRQESEIDELTGPHHRK